MKKLILVIVTLFYSFSSMAQNTSSQSTKMQKVMVIHDEVMLKGKQLTEQKMKWLNEEEGKVIKLREQINSSMEDASKLLEL